MTDSSNIIINTDGGSRGNPGPAAIGVVFSSQNGELIHCHRECIGEATNNQAEYRAIIKALEILLKSNWQKNNGEKSKITCYLDSMLVVEQINGNYKVKNHDIKQYIEKLSKLIKEIGKPVDFVHIPRERNKQADKLVNQALDENAEHK
ncbi:MAG: 14.7 kDa ribonuclease H-like protein [bacterium ADurb.Bin212]|nr:MAG: 14.7 kDa ribonuclease H-like protein [bacterium ADurb.Bin212]